MKRFYCLLLLIMLLYSARGASPDSLMALTEKYIDSVAPALPMVEVLFDERLEDPSICIGPDKTYYITGTSGDIDGVQSGIKIWASRDMKNWNLIGSNNGYVWTFDADGAPWQNEISTRNGWKQRGIMAPSLHYLKNNYWIVYSNSNTNTIGILRSLSGRAQGPYTEATERGLVEGKHPSLVSSVDSTVYLLCDEGKLYQLNDELNAMVSEIPFYLSDARGMPVVAEGINITLVDDKYILTGSSRPESDPNEVASGECLNPMREASAAFIAVSDDLLTGYRQVTNIPHGGGGEVFRDLNERYFLLFSGKGNFQPVNSVPSVISLKGSPDKGFAMNHPYPFFPDDRIPVVYVSRYGNNSTGTSWANAFTTLKRAVDLAANGSQIWVAGDRYEGPIELNLREGVYIFGGFKGNEQFLSERDPQLYPTIIDGRRNTKNVISIKSSRYIRVEGLTITRGNASDGSQFQRYGAGIHLLGGGETVRIVNCVFEDNQAQLDGGAFYASIGASPLLLNCTFRNNVSRRNGGAVAIYCNMTNGYHSRLYNCSFDDNFAYGNGGAVFFDTNRRNHGVLELVNALVVRNKTLGHAGAIALNGSAGLSVVNASFVHNSGISKGPVLGSFGRVPATARLLNCIMYENNGGTLFEIEGEAQIAVNEAGEAVVLKRWVAFENCVFYANEVNSIVTRNFDRKSWQTIDEVNASILGENCVEYDPKPIDLQNGNYRMQGLRYNANMGSPCYFPFTIDNQRRQHFNSPGCY